MDIIRFNNPNDSMLMSSGSVVSDITSVMWIERYRDPGEFTIVAPTASKVQEMLPRGCYISHTETNELMIVENHEIQEDQGKSGTVTITGRSFETILESRVVGQNSGFPKSAPFTDYTLASDFVSNQVIKMLGEHILPISGQDPGMVLPYIHLDNQAINQRTAGERTVPRDNLHKASVDLLAIDDLGIKTIRPSYWNGVSTSYTTIQIHMGIDKSASVSFSYMSGEIISSDYLWSNKNYKNGAIVRGTWVEVIVTPSQQGSSRKMLYIDASDVDSSFKDLPTGADYTKVVSDLKQRGRDVLLKMNDIALTKAEISHQVTQAQYRNTYDLGDTIMVYGDYNETAKMRVIEFVESWDSNGFVGYPTLVNL